MMRRVPPPPWLKNWRTDPAAALLGLGFLGGAVIGGLQLKSAAQIQAIRVEARRDRAASALNLQEIRTDLAQLQRSADHKRNAKLAVESGRTAIARGEWGRGQIFFINAITNDPGEVGHLKAYAAAVLTHEPPVEALDQLNSILQMAACHIPPDDVSTALGLIEQVDRRKVALQTGKPTPPPAADPESGGDGLDAEWARLRVAPADLHRDLARLATHLRALENFAATLEEQDHPDEARIQEVADQIRRWTEIAQAARNVAYVDQCLAKLTDEKLSQTDNDRAVAIVQAAEAVLPSFWGLAQGILPGELQGKINAYPARIKERIDAISLTRSTELMKQIDAKLVMAVDVDKLPRVWGKTLGPIEKVCLGTEEQVKQAQIIAAQLSSSDRILAAQAKIERWSQTLQKARSEQYSKYQAEVVQRCNEAFKLFQTQKYGVSEETAIKIFHNERLESVDQSLLAPEVSRLFNDILGKLMAEMNPEQLVKIEGEMSSAKKLKLEEF